MEFLMYYVTFITYVSYLPQIFKLLKTKSSHDISLISYIMWLSSGFCSITYSILLKDWLLVLANGSNFALTLTTFLLSWYYRKDRSR